MTAFTLFELLIGQFLPIDRFPRILRDFLLGLGLKSTKSFLNSSASSLVRNDQETSSLSPKSSMNSCAFPCDNVTRLSSLRVLITKNRSVMVRTGSEIFFTFFSQLLGVSKPFFFMLYCTSVGLLLRFLGLYSSFLQQHLARFCERFSVQQWSKPRSMIVIVLGTYLLVVNEG